MRFADRNNPDLQAVAKDKILHIELIIVGSHVIRATDVLPGMGTISQGNAVQLNLEPDTRSLVSSTSRERRDKNPCGSHVAGRLLWRIDRPVWYGLDV